MTKIDLVSNVCRKSRKEKDSFLNNVIKALEERNIEYFIHFDKKPDSRNLIVGNINQADTLYVTNYDTKKSHIISKYLFYIK